MGKFTVPIFDPKQLGKVDDPLKFGTIVVGFQRLTNGAIRFTYSGKPSLKFDVIVTSKGTVIGKGARRFRNFIDGRLLGWFERAQEDKRFSELIQE